MEVTTLLLILIGLIVAYKFFGPKPTPKSLRGQTVLITGGGSGIGRLQALEYAKEGAKIVVLWDINQAGLDSVQKEVSALKTDCRTYVCDVSKRPNIYAVADQVKKDVGKIDILVNNAGIVSGEFFLDLKDENIERVFNVNTMAVIWTIKAFLPDMVKQNSGHLVTISSASAMSGVPKLSDYAASKWAAFGFMESLRLEFAKKKWNIQTTTICPFYIATGMFEGAKSKNPLLPILKPDYVVSQIMNAVKTNNPVLYLPKTIMIAYIIRFIPEGLRDFLDATFFGVSSSMDEFHGLRKLS